MYKYDPKFINDFDDPIINKESIPQIHIRIQQRNARKTITTCQGIPKKFDTKRILKEFRKVCKGAYFINYFTSHIFSHDNIEILR